MTEHTCEAVGVGCLACAAELTKPYPVAGSRARQVEWLAAVYEVPACMVDHDWPAWKYVPIFGGPGNYSRRCQRARCTAFQVQSAANWAPGMGD